MNEWMKHFIFREMPIHIVIFHWVPIRHGVKPFQKGLSPSPRPYQKGLSPSPFSKPFFEKGLKSKPKALSEGLKSKLKPLIKGLSPDLSLLGLKKGLKRAWSSSIKGLSPSPDLSPFIKGGLKSGFKPSQKRA